MLDATILAAVIQLIELVASVSSLHLLFDSLLIHLHCAWIVI
jgi:hypothetical protein